MNLQRDVTSASMAAITGANNNSSPVHAFTQQAPVQSPPNTSVTSMELTPTSGRLMDTTDEQQFEIGSYHVSIKKDPNLAVPDIVLFTLAERGGRYQIDEAIRSSYVWPMPYQVPVEVCKELFSLYPGVVKVNTRSFPESKTSNCYVTFKDLESTVNFFKSHLVINKTKAWLRSGYMRNSSDTPYSHDMMPDEASRVDSRPATGRY